MEKINILAVVIVVIAAAALVIFLIWKNQRDRQLINPDAEDAVGEAIGDKERRRDKQ